MYPTGLYIPQWLLPAPHFPIRNTGLKQTQLGHHWERRIFITRATQWGPYHREEQHYRMPIGEPILYDKFQFINLMPVVNPSVGAMLSLFNFYFHLSRIIEEVYREGKYIVPIEVKYHLPVKVYSIIPIPSNLSSQYDIQYNITI